MSTTERLPPVIATLKEALERMGHTVTVRRNRNDARRYRISGHPGELPGDAFVRKAEKLTGPNLLKIMEVD